MIDPVAMYAPLATEATRSTAASARSAGEAFEGMFVRLVMDEVAKSSPSFMKSGHAQMFSGMFSEAFTQEIVASGALGLRDLIDHPDLATVPRASGPLPVRRDRSFALPRVTSAFGERTDPIDGSRKRHSGVDIGAAAGTPIHAAAKGVVAFAGEAGGYGNVVIIDHGDGRQTRYAHCRTLHVREGQAVSAGDDIAEVGSTGRSTGPHLHFEVRENGRAIDPSDWIPSLGLIPAYQPAPVIRGAEQAGAGFPSGRRGSP